MPTKYDVTGTFEAYAHLTLEADSEEEAKEQFWEMVKAGDVPIKVNVCFVDDEEITERAIYAEERYPTC